MARITTDSYWQSRPPTRSVADALSVRLRVAPRAVHELARKLDVSLKWLDIATGPDVAAGTPSSFEAMIVLGLDPITGEPLEVASEAAV